MENFWKPAYGPSQRGKRNAMQLEFNRKEKIAGFFVVFVGIMLIVTVISIGRGKDWFKTYVIYYTTFDESYNLQENASVKLFNAEIGKVKSIVLSGDRVIVKLAILEQYAHRIRKDATATVQSPTFIGSEYISIKPGSAAAEPIPEEGEIPSVAKKSIANFLEEFQVEKTAKMVIRAFQDISEAVVALKDPDGPLFSALNRTERAMAHMESIVKTVDKGEGTLGSLIRTDALMEHILNNLDQISGILKDVGIATAEIPGAVDRAKAIEDGIYEAIPRVKEILAEIRASALSLKKTLQNIETGSQDIPRVTRAADRGIQEIRQGVENIDAVVESLQQNFLIRKNLPPEPEGRATDAGLRR